MDVKDDFYARMKRVAMELTAELGRPVTIREVLLRLLKKEQLDPRDFARSWRFNEPASDSSSGS